VISPSWNASATGGGRQAREALRNARERLHLSRREAQTLARVVAEAREAERMLDAPAEEAPREDAQHPAPACPLARETTQVAVEDERQGTMSAGGA